MKKEIKDYPILFSTPMVQAILKGRKTQTRRVVKIDGMLPYTGMKPLSTHECGSVFYFWGNKEIKCPYGQPGDVLWVRESFYPLISEGLKGKYFYKADLEKQGFVFKWKPSIHMPKEACRIFLRITNVRVERLQDISEKDAIAEGIEEAEFDRVNNCRVFKYYGWQNAVTDEKESFKSLWQSINGEQSWNDNPWVWVIEFERVKKI